jgi:hypothetical protein
MSDVVRPSKPVAPSVDALHETIRAQIEATNRQSTVFMRLTWAAIFLGVIQAIGTVVQVWLTFKQH